MTEQVNGGACAWLEHNVDINRLNGIPLQNVDVQPCDWNSYIHLLNNRTQGYFFFP